MALAAGPAVADARLAARLSAPARSFARELYAPLPDDFAFPYFEHFSFYDHHGSFRESWAGPSCSVADRPTDIEPSAGNYHFVMDVHDFLAVYPYPIGVQTSSVTCTFVTFAQNAKWRDFIVDGSMLRTAEEFTLMHYIGNRSASETSPGALRHIFGKPSYTVSTFDHGDPFDSVPVKEKNFDIYLRGLPVVAPSHLVPVSLQRPRASHPDPVVQMKLRSSFPLPFARAHVRAWQRPHLPPHAKGVAARAAFEVAPGYVAHRQKMLCNYWAFASQFAPQVSAAELSSPARARLLIAMPMGHTGACVATLVPRAGACFATPLLKGVPLLQQMSGFLPFLPCDAEPQQMGQTRDARADVIFALPCAFPVVNIVSDHDDWLLVPKGLQAAWCSSDVLTDQQALLASIAFERCKSFIQAVPWLGGTIGVYEGPRPVFEARNAEAFRSASVSGTAMAEWEEFLSVECSRRELFLRAYERADGGSGILAPFIENIVTAFDLANDLTPPPQGLPPVQADVILQLAYPEPPAPLHTCYLARMPPQSAPIGFPESFAWNEVCRGWGRRIMANCFNMTMAHDCECVRNGWSDLPRHPFTCLGPGVFKSFHFTDGGSVRLNQFILVQGDDGRLRLLDFAMANGDHKSLEAIIGAMGFTTDKELLSFLIHGMRWKVEAPRQFRIGHNLFSLKSRAKGVGEATAKLVSQGLFDAVCVMEEGAVLTKDSACPLWTTPQYSMGMGGADKNDKPLEKRPTGNVSEPHSFTRERNSPHGEPDGDVVINFNDLTGPKQPKSGPTLPSGFPDREHKYRVRNIYHANAYIAGLAHVNKSCPGVSRDDVRWMFFQIFTEPCEYWLQIQYLVIAYCMVCKQFEIFCICTIGDRIIVLRLWRIRPRVINMGTRPSSKVAVRFSKQLNVEWRDRMADFVHSGWLDRQSDALKQVLADREKRLGYEQAHPFWCCEWTDDFWDLACEVELSAHGALTRRRLTTEINLWMSAKTSCGTTGDYIGARCCVTGGFGTVSVAKRGRCITDTIVALSDQSTKDELHAHNSFIVHLVDVLDLDPSVLDGLWAPDKLPLPGFAVIPLSDARCAEHMRGPFSRLRARYLEIINLVSTRPAASFMSGVRDVPDSQAPECRLAIYVRMGSDCRASPQAMRIFGHALEYEWFLALDEIDPEWLVRHVNVGESTGAAVNVAVFGLMFGTLQLIQEGDNTTEGAMLLGKSKVADQQNIKRLLISTPGFQACKQSLWFEHAYGTGLGFDDAGSREKHAVLAGLSAAFGRRRTPINAMQVPGVSQLLADILRSTTYYVKKPKVHGKRVRFMPSASDLRAEDPGERGDGDEASARSTKASEALSPTPPRPCARVLRPAGQQQALSPTPNAPPADARLVSPIPMVIDRDGGRLSPTPPRAPSGSLAAAGVRRSPQPLNAKAARAAAALSAADKLLDASNPYLMGSGAPSSTVAMVVASKECAHSGIPRSTLDHDSWGFKWASRFCMEHDMPVMRPKCGSLHIDADAESEIYALMCFWIAPRMKPAPRKLEKGIGSAQPPSAMQAVYAYRRVLRDCGRYLGDLHKSAMMLKGMNAAFLKAWGQEALAPDHHVPFALSDVRLLREALVSYAILHWARVLHDAVCVIALFCLVRGPRLDEWCRMFAGDTFYLRANFVWVRGRDLIGSTAAAVAISGPADGWLLRVRNVPSKTDRTGQKWLGRYMWYVYRTASTLNFPAQWLQWETVYPCPEGLRSAWPAFSPSGDHQPFSPTVARSCLRTLLTHVGGAELANLHAWHDWRATIASALKGAGKSDAEVQAIVCWASAASVQLYGQLTPELMAASAELATTVDASRHAHLPTPHVGPLSVAAEIEACAAEMAGTPAMKSAPRKAASTVRTKPAHCENRKRRRPPSPVVAISSGAITADIGEPHGVVQVDTAVGLAGTTVSIKNAAWRAGSGSTSCTITGVVAGASAPVLYVVSDGENSYPFSSHALVKWSKLKPSQLGCDAPEPLRPQLAAASSPVPVSRAVAVQCSAVSKTPPSRAVVALRRSMRSPAVAPATAPNTKGPSSCATATPRRSPRLRKNKS